MTEEDRSIPSIEITAEERAGLERVSSAEPPFSQRAQALLALSEGADLEGAAITADLTVNQVRYWLGRFGTRRLSIFPDELLAEQIAEEDGQMELPLLEAPEEAPMLEAPEFAGELPETVPDNPKAAATAAGGTAVVKSKKKKKKSKSGKKKKKSESKKKKSKKDKDSKKSKKDKKDKKDKKSKKDKKDKKSKKKK